MKKSSILLFLFALPCLNTYAQQTVGLFTNTPGAFNGYTLFAPNNGKDTYLINNCGEKVHSWTNQYDSGFSNYLMENGTLLKTSRSQGEAYIEMVDWNSDVIWSYSPTGSHGRQHHDIELLPNGNVLIIAQDVITQAEVGQAGSSTPNATLTSEQIIEVQPDLINGGGTIVWEWKAWDHLIQDADPTKDNYGTVSQRPERIDINFLNHNNSDWLHCNAVAYNEEFDQIVLSIPNFDEFWIIDHSATTAEAAGSSGGTYGKGGDLLYRWGNPRAYGQGTVNDQKLFFQHNAHWIPDGLLDAGKILLFNNRAGEPVNQDYSTVNIVDLPVGANGFYTYLGGAFGPTDFDWTYKAPNPTDFFSGSISGAHRLENGNTLICQGVGGRFFEVDPNEDIVWEYINPVNDLGPITQDTIAQDNNVFRCTRYAPDFPGFEGKTLTPQGYIEIGSTFPCDLYIVGTSSEGPPNSDYMLYPNPAKDFIGVSTADKPIGDLKAELFNVNGQRLMTKILKKGNTEFEIDVSALNNGIYLITVSNELGAWTEKVVVTK